MMLAFKDFEAAPVRQSRNVQLTTAAEGNLNVADTSTPSTYPNRWPSGVIVGLFIGALTLALIILGFVVTMDIQTPQRFEGGEKKR
jgi:hypothetical protein